MGQAWPSFLCLGDVQALNGRAVFQGVGARSGAVIRPTRSCGVQPPAEALPGLCHGAPGAAMPLLRVACRGRAAQQPPAMHVSTSHMTRSPACWLLSLVCLLLPAPRWPCRIVASRSKQQLPKDFFTNLTPGYQLYPAIFLLPWTDPAAPSACRPPGLSVPMLRHSFVPLRRLHP